MAHALIRDALQSGQICGLSIREVRWWTFGLSQSFPFGFGWQTWQWYAYITHPYASIGSAYGAVGFSL